MCSNGVLGTRYQRLEDVQQRYVRCTLSENSSRCHQGTLGARYQTLAVVCSTGTLGARY